MPKLQPTVTAVPKVALTHKAIEELVAKATAGKIEDAAVTLFDAIMQFAHGGGASDVHLEPWRKGQSARSGRRHSSRRVFFRGRGAYSTYSPLENFDSNAH